MKTAHIPENASRSFIDRLIMDYRSAKILFTAASLDLFSKIQEGREDVPSLCRVLKTRHRPTRILLDSLVALGFLRLQSGKYKNTSMSKSSLIRGQRYFIGDNLHYQNILWECWSDLNHILKNDRPKYSLQALMRRQRKGFLDSYIHGMSELAVHPAKLLAAAVPLSAPQRMLDLGSGPGAYAQAFLEKYPSLHADLLDLPGTLAITRHILESSLHRNRITLIPGDYGEADFKSQSYDLVLLSHITHNEGPALNQRLVHKAYLALRPGGRIAIHDFMVSPDRTAPLFSALFAVHMLVCTKSGNTYSANEYKSWLRQAGFKNIETFKIPSLNSNHTQVAVGVKEQ